MLNRVRVTESDGNLGIRPALSGLPLALIGQCTSGTANAPASFADPDKLRAAFGVGRAVDAACYAIKTFGLTVVFAKSTTSVAADYGTVDSSDHAGSSTVTLETSGSNKPNDDYEIVLKFSTSDGTPGTVGSASPAISIAASLDAGRAYEPAMPLGTANFYVTPGTNVKAKFAAGTFNDGDIVRVTVAAEHADANDLGDALEALRTTALPYELIEFTSPVDAAIVGVADEWLVARHAEGKHKDFICHYRLQDLDEDDATYMAAFNTEFAAFADTSMYICAGAAKVASAISRGRRYRRAPSHPLGAQLAAVSEEIDISALDFRLPGVTILDANGNPDPGYYNEAVSPGLDDMRAMTLRTWEGETGVFCNNPRLISPVGSDFDFSPKRRVMNLARSVAESWLRRNVISKPLRVDKSTGHVKESELLALEAGLNAELRRAVTAKPKASSVRVVLSRNDEILQAPYPLTGRMRLVPLAYPKDISIDAGWELSEPIEVLGAGTGG